MTMAQATRVLAENPQWVANLQGDHAHELERWFRGSGRARLSLHRYYRSYKGTKDPSLLNEEQLIQQGDQMNSANSHLVRQGVRLTVLRSAELNYPPPGK